MTTWYGVQRISDGAIISYVSDDAPNYDQLRSGLQLTSGFTSQRAAMQALQPAVLSPEQTTMNALRGKASGAWTLSDVADWLKAKG